MENKKEYCENLYNRYQELRARTRIVSYDKKDLGKVPFQHLDVAEMQELDEIKKGIIECLEFLSDKQLEGLYDDDDTELVNAAVNIIVKRKLKK